MKLKNLLPLLFLFLGAHFNFYAQNLEAINQAMKVGDYKTISKNFGENVDLKLPGTDGVFNKTQAELILKDFFLTSPISEYIVKHNGKSKNDAHFIIGSLMRNGKLFRTYILFKQTNSAYKILEFNIELDE